MCKAGTRNGLAVVLGWHAMPNFLLILDSGDYYGGGGAYCMREKI